MYRIPLTIPETGPYSIMWCEQVAEDIIKKTDKIVITPDCPTIYFGLDHEKLHKDVQDFLDAIHNPNVKTTTPISIAYDKLYKQCKNNGRVNELLMKKNEYVPKEEQIISGFWWKMFTKS